MRMGAAFSRTWTWTALRRPYHPEIGQQDVALYVRQDARHYAVW
jgi:hypothetical protein